MLLSQQLFTPHSLILQVAIPDLELWVPHLAPLGQPVLLYHSLVMPIVPVPHFEPILHILQACDLLSRPRGRNPV